MAPENAARPYCGLTDHTGREHLQFVMSLSDPPGDPEEEIVSWLN